MNIGDTINFDGREMTRKKGAKEALVIPKEWQKKFKVKIVAIHEKHYEVEMPEPVFIYENGKRRNLWRLGIPIDGLFGFSLEEINKLEVI